jgi:uncharacterized protein (TIGR02217 family)
LISFFRARHGAAKAFRFRDPLDHSATTQLLGTGDAVQTVFPLVKRYGAGPDAEVRPISRPVAGSVVVFIGGVQQISGWTLANGAVSFGFPPANGAAVTADFSFDVPVRFADDQLDIDAVTFAAGDAPHVPLIEVREG